MNYTTKPVGYATTIKTLGSLPKEIWDTVMTIEKSPLKNLDPIAGHMIFQCLFFVWSGLFAAMLGSILAFGISAVFHMLLISGITVTAVTFRQAEKNPESINKLVKSGIKYNGRAAGGEHE